MELSDRELLNALNRKLDTALAMLEELSGKRQKQLDVKKSKALKVAPLTEDEIASAQATFARLYTAWLAGEETAVHGELSKMDAVELRRFADANNLNVTTKMPVERVLHLISARFREKRQLTVGVIYRRKDESESGTP